MQFRSGSRIGKLPPSIHARPYAKRRDADKTNWLLRGPIRVNPSPVSACLYTDQIHVLTDSFQ